jgi:two-component system, chemotaxis family, protein-glutamate methylesterase/glutaminase
MDRRKKLLIVDDSRFMRQAIGDFFAADDGIEVIGEAENGAEALEAIANLKPDVVTLDVNMPVMDGLTALKHLMIRSPCPTVMLSTLMKEGAQTTFDALRYGALDFVLKPSNLKGNDLERQRQEICRKVRLAAEVEVATMRYIRAVHSDKPQSSAPAQRVVILGAAEGGYSALLKVIPHLKADIPGVAYLVVLYAAPAHVDVFTDYLERFSAMRVRRARDGEQIQTGVCYLSAGAEYVTFRHQGNDLALHVTEAPFPWRRGSINRVLFSAAEILGSQSCGVLLSGAGDDGAEGLSEVLGGGGMALVQDPRTCLDKEMVLNAQQACDLHCLSVPDLAISEMLNDLLG